MTFNAPVRPELFWFASRLLRIESTLSLWLNRNCTNWLPALPSGRIAVASNVATGSTPLLPVTFCFIVVSFSMFSTVVVGLPNESAARMR